MVTADLAASTIDHVINDSGFGVLAAGSLVLDKNLHPSFYRGRPQIGGNILAVVALDGLEDPETFKNLVEADMRDPLFLQPFVDQLVYAALRQFEAHCPSFEALPIGNMFGE